MLARISHSLVKDRIFSTQNVNESGAQRRQVCVRANASVLVPIWCVERVFSSSFFESGNTRPTLVVRVQSSVLAAVLS